MASDEHVALLMQGVVAWNEWRLKNPDTRPDLYEADLSGAKLSGANLKGAHLRRANLDRANLVRANLTGANARGANLTAANLTAANLTGAHLRGATLRAAQLVEANLTLADLTLADLTGAELREANLRGAHPSGANLSKANLSGVNLGGLNLHGANLLKANLSRANLGLANLWRANLDRANLVRANLRGAVLEAATLVKADLTEADLTGCRIYGISAWNLKLERAKQQNLVITPADQPAVVVDDLEVAQFICLLLDREKIRNVINTVTRRGVLLLGRFGDGGLALLQAIAAWLRTPENGGYLPLLFDFPRPDSKTYTDTVRTLASVARFVIVDLSGPSVPQEITATVDLYEIPFVPILEEKRKDWSMFQDFLVKQRVLEPVRFTDQNHLLQLLAKEVIAPAEKLVEERQQRLDKIFGRAH